MGMAASQARYLGLTARKTNVEYEGQQINQARTALGNQSATLWNQMLTLSVPTAPNITDFTTLQYSYSDGYNNYTISNIASAKYEEDGVKYNAQVTYYYNQDSYKAIQARNTNPQVQATKGVATSRTDNVEIEASGTGYKMTDGVETVTTVQCSEASMTQAQKEELATILGKDVSALTDEDYAKYQFFTYNNGAQDINGYATVVDLQRITDSGVAGKLPFSTIQNTSYMLGNSKAVQYDPSDIEQKQAFEQIRHDYPDVFAGYDLTTEGQDIWVYQKNGQTMFARGIDLDKCMVSGEDAYKKDEYQISSPIDYQGPLNQYYATTLTQRVDEKDYAILDDASGSGRYSTIKLRNMSEAFNLKSEEVTDEAEYNQAMNQYNYNVTKYEKSLADINAKTKIIQEQDRQLELRLKQLETEQKALSTEMDAVKGIIQKNVESTFKTFS